MKDTEGLEQVVELWLFLKISVESKEQGYDKF